MKWERLRELKKQATDYKSAVNEASAHISDKTAKDLPTSVFEQWEGNKLYDVVRQTASCSIRSWAPEQRR